MEKYSVLMSVYYKEKPEYLKKAIESMLNQTVKPDEFIIVKDGPLTEDLDNVINEYVDKEKDLFTIVSLEKNLGLGLALNEGLKVARNELIARMDSDDISLPNRCEEQLGILKENSNIDIIGGDIAEFIDNEDNIIGKRIVPTQNVEIKEYMKKRCAMNHMTVMYKRKAVEESGGYKDWFWNEDYYLWIRMLENNIVFANTGTVLVHVRCGKEMYQRRGGKKYFTSEVELQKYMLNKNIISKKLYCANVIKRFIVQILLPNRIRGFIFRAFARKK